MARSSRIEVSSVGVDEALVGFSTDPFGSAFPTTSGLRVPAFVNTPSTRYLFLLATLQVSQGCVTRVRGWRQLLTIGMSSPHSESGIPSRPIEMEVTTPTFRFPDGNVSWHLVREAPFNVPNQRPATDLPSFAFKNASQSALLYQSATFSAETGLYMLNMTAYTPPVDRLSVWEPVADLGNVRDLRSLWRTNQIHNLEELVAGPCRVSLYASVLQTNPATRPLPVLPATPPVNPPEEAFINAMQAAAGAGTGVVYWRVGGALLFEDPNDPDGR